MTLYKFTIWYEDSDFENDTLQNRYVVAESEEEAREKLQAENLRMGKLGFAVFEIGRCTIEANDVII